MDPYSLFVVQTVLLCFTDEAISFPLSPLYYPPNRLLSMAPNGTLVVDQTSCIPPKSMRSCRNSCTKQGDIYPACHCDPFCQFFSDCCYDYHQCAIKTETIEFHQLLDQIIPYVDYIECANSIQASANDPYFGEYMIRRCPKSYRNPLIKTKCEELENEFTRMQPRTDLKSGVTFRNVYCSQCHYRGLDDTKPWGHDSHLCGEITPETLIWTYFELGIFDNVGFCPPNVLQGVTDRSCLAPISGYRQMQDTENLIGACQNPAEIDIERKCHAILDPILGSVDNLPLAFRNRYCAECNGLNPGGLFCGPYAQIKPTPPVEPDFVQDIETSVPSLTSLINIRLDPCAQDEIRDLSTNECHRTKQCGPGFIEFKYKCIINPVDTYTYNNPVYENGDVLSVYLDLLVPDSLTLLLHKHTSLEEVFIRAFAKHRRGMLRTGQSSIVSMTTNGRISTLPIRDGHIYTISGPLSLHFKVKIENGLDSTMAVLSSSLLIYNQPHYDKFRARFRIFSRGVLLPLKCEHGELITVQLNDTYTELLSELGRPNITKTHLVEYNQNNDDQHPHPKIHLCNLALPKFQNCTLQNYSTELFSKSSVGLVSDFGTIPNGDYFISRDLIFTCEEMIDAKQDLLHARVLGYITIASFLVSFLFLLYTLLTYGLFEQLRTTPGKMIMNLSAILFLAKISLLISKLGANNRIVCMMIGIVQHYLWLTMFVCMNAIAIFTVRTFTSKALRTVSASRLAFRVAILYTYGLPSLVIAICLGFHAYSQHGIYGALNVASSCWIKSRSIFLYAFVAPFCTLLAINFILFLATTRAIHATRAGATNSSLDLDVKWEISLYVRLSFLMGFTWIFGVLGVFYQSIALNYLFVMANSLTGVYLAVGFTCTGHVFDLYRNRSQKQRSSSIKTPAVYTIRSEHMKHSSSGKLTELT